MLSPAVSSFINHLPLPILHLSSPLTHPRHTLTFTSTSSSSRPLSLPRRATLHRPPTHRLKVPPPPQSHGSPFLQVPSAPPWAVGRGQGVGEHSRGSGEIHYRGRGVRGDTETLNLCVSATWSLKQRGGSRGLDMRPVTDASREQEGGDLWNWNRGSHTNRRMSRCTGIWQRLSTWDYRWYSKTLPPHKFTHLTRLS